MDEWLSGTIEAAGGDVEVVDDRLEFSADGANLAPATLASLRLVLIPIEGAPPAVRTTTGVPVASRSSTALTRAGRRVPSARTMSRAISRAAPCIRSIGA